METKEFNLSEKIFNYLYDRTGKGDIKVKDIKEFIKLVQEVVLSKGRRAKLDIDKLAGDKLI